MDREHSLGCSNRKEDSDWYAEVPFCLQPEFFGKHLVVAIFFFLEGTLWHHRHLSVKNTILFCVFGKLYVCQTPIFNTPMPQASDLVLEKWYKERGSLGCADPAEQGPLQHYYWL